jgi:glyoxylase-like metal-dependent hydrolase (beta-lactamase superfamily II)
LEILPGVYRIDLRVSNCFLIVDETELTLIDAGVRRSYNPLINFIQSLGYSPHQLKNILLTHADLDHVGAAPALREINGAKIFSSQIEADALAEGRSSRQIRTDLLTPFFSWAERQNGSMYMQVDQILKKGDRLPILGGLQVIDTPGHTPGHISFFAPRYKLLFAGDSVSTQPDTVRYNRMKLFNWDEAQMRASVHLQAAIRPEIVCSGHGPVVFDAADKFPEE